MSLLEYKCPHCGAALQYEAGTQSMTCPYCDSSFAIEELGDLEGDLDQDKASEALDWGYEGQDWMAGEQEGMAVYACNSCGGEIIGDETLGATSCPFCGNRVVITSKFSGTLRPDIIIPFKLNKEEALKALEKHYTGKRLLPKVFKDKNHLDEIKGVYVPFWLFDADVDVKATYEATKVRSWSDSDYNYKETSYFQVRRQGDMGFDLVPVDGSDAIDDTLMESLEPFKLEEAVDFQTAFLAGYFANKYDVDAEACSPRAHERVKNSASSAFRDTVRGYTSVQTTYEDIKLESGQVRYALLPVWLLSTSWEGQNFLFAMNGQTGKFVGNLPMDKKLRRAWFFKIFGIAALVLVALSQFFVGR